MDFTYQRKQPADRRRKQHWTGSTSCAPACTADDVPAGDVVRAYKNLEQAERAFGSLKGPDLQIRPIHHHLENRVRAHVLICMLAYYLTWHLKAAWKPLLFTDEHRPAEPRPGRESHPLTRRAAQGPDANEPATAPRLTATERCSRELATQLQCGHLAAALRKFKSKIT